MWDGPVITYVKYWPLMCVEYTFLDMSLYSKNPNTPHKMWDEGSQVGRQTLE